MNRIAEILLDWYAREGRDLPWRRTRDPYRIWLSEVILQQTRVAQGMEYYLRFTERFPDVASLAAAPEDEGLSYIAVSEDGALRVTLRDAVYWAKGDIIGENLWKKYERWPVYSKFFDNLGPLPHHIHHRQEHAA